MKKKRKPDLYDFFYRELRIIFLLLALLGIAGNILDIIIYRGKEISIYYQNLPVLVILSALILLHFRFKFPLKAAFIIGLYSIYINTFTGILIQNMVVSEFLLFFMRESVFFLLMIITAALFIGKSHALYTGSGYLLLFLHVTVRTQNEFLRDNAPMVLIILLSFIVIVYIFNNFLGKAVTNLKEKNSTVENQNQAIRDINHLLTGSHFRVQEQNKQLKDLNIDLKQKSADLDLLNKQLSKKNVELIIRENELSSLNNDKDRFFSILAHDMKNHLNTLMGFSSLLSLELGNVDDEKLNMYSGMISRTGKELFDLLENLLYWGRMQMDGFMLKPAKISLYTKAAAVISFPRLPRKKRSILKTILIRGLQ